MKTKRTLITTFCCTIIAVLFLRSELLANGGPKTEPNKTAAVTTSYTFQVKNSAERCNMIDSAIIVLDKYDLTGAGFIVRTVSVNMNQELELSDVPAGKYYASIYTYGLRRDRISTVITVTPNTKKKKINKTNIKFSEGEIYIKGQASIPAEDKKLFAYIKF
jgi:hypothetical protein